MRALIQRVSEAWVAVDEDGGSTEVARIGSGLLVLAGFGSGDGEEALAWTAAKVADLRLFPAGGSGFDRSVAEVGGEILVVSQFTLYGDVRKGRRPDFGGAAPHAEAEALYDRFRALLGERLPGCVAAGTFGARMEVGLVNDGPVTLWLER